MSGGAGGRGGCACSPSRVEGIADICILFELNAIGFEAFLHPLTVLAPHLVIDSIAEHLMVIVVYLVVRRRLHLIDKFDYTFSPHAPPPPLRRNSCADTKRAHVWRAFEVCDIEQYIFIILKGELMHITCVREWGF